jgi:NTP pyrophosphatase (non-canonical NTP hydrolase)
VTEVGELSELFQWRGDDAGIGWGLPGWTAAEVEHAGEELADVLISTIQLADSCSVDLPFAVRRKIDMNARKYPASINGLANGSQRATENTKAAVGQEPAKSRNDTDDQSDL